MTYFIFGFLWGGAAPSFSEFAKHTYAQLNMCPGSPRNLRAQSVALHRSAIISAGHSNDPITFQNNQKMQKSSFSA